MVAKNEEGRYLEQVLKSLVGHIDEAVIIDDASTDETIRLCEKILKDIPLHIVRNTESLFANEVELGKKQWEETTKTNPDWILNLDADELVEDAFWERASASIDNKDCKSCAFRLYDMWNKTQYREDLLWNAHNSSRTFMIRYREDVSYIWSETPQHCGRFPINCDILPKAEIEYRVQHLGWSSKEDRTAKYNRY